MCQICFHSNIHGTFSPLLLVKINIAYILKRSSINLMIVIIFILVFKGDKMALKQVALDRMEFIESRLYWKGQIGRQELMDTLGISKPQATLEFKRYREEAPKNIHYDISLKCYVPTPGFKPKFYIPNPYEYLSNLKQFNEKNIDDFNPAFGDAPKCENVEVLTTCIDPIILRDVTFAMNNENSIHIKYQGMDDDAKGREIYPKALFFDGMRWQIRAYCFERTDYRTFTISRILKVIKSEKNYKDVPDDVEWDEIIKVIIMPNPSRSEGQQETICNELGMTDQEKIVKVRKNLLPYFLLANRLYPLDDGGNIVIQNKEEIVNTIKGKPIDFFR